MVGNRLRDFRRAWDISEGQMAKMLLVSDEKYEALESNKYIPNEAEIAQMASLLGVEKDFLESGEYNMQQIKQKVNQHMQAPSGCICTEKFCGWRQNCGGGKFYCPGKGCMKEWEKKHG